MSDKKRFWQTWITGDWRPPMPGFSKFLVVVVLLFVVLFVIGLISSI